ncbi:MAG: COG2426 family protein [Armatimonadota bacterium]|jgi:uncharacterized membrane protein
MREAILDALSSLPGPVAVAIASALPISEVRGGIPLGIFEYKMPLVEILPIAIAANVLIIIPVLLWFNPIADWMMERGILTGIVRRLLARARSKKPLVDKHGIYALTLLVAVPLPVTGAWTGALVASVFEMNFMRAVLCIALGVVIASAIVSALCLGGIWTYHATTG